MTLKTLHEQGAIRLLHQRGLLSSEVLLYFNYYDDYVLFRQQKTYRESILLVALKYSISETTVERAIRKLRD